MGTSCAIILVKNEKGSDGQNQHRLLILNIRKVWYRNIISAIPNHQYIRFLKWFLIQRGDTLLIQRSKRVQTTLQLLAPLIFSTPFPITRYQNNADYGEWCCFSCEITQPFRVNRGKTIFFSILRFAQPFYSICIQNPRTSL